jgi:hypothetical protein
VVAHAHEDDPVERRVGLAVAAAVEPVAARLAEEAGIGEEPQSIEKAASERSRSGLSPAASSGAPGRVGADRERAGEVWGGCGGELGELGVEAVDLGLEQLAAARELSEREFACGEG